MKLKYQNNDYAYDNKAIHVLHLNLQFSAPGMSTLLL